MPRTPRSARPARRPVWLDPRFVIGLVLVLASTGGVVALLRSADTSVVVMAAGAPLDAGRTVHASDLVPVRVRLDTASGLYLTPDAAEGMVVTRFVGAGELVPRSSLSSADARTSASVVITTAAGADHLVVPGTVVDVWAAASKGSGTSAYEAPRVVVSGATVSQVIQPQGFVADQDHTQVQLTVPRQDVAAVIASTDARDEITLVPVGDAGA
ncbi:flagella basal body P-ring formation protein FlgA [Clavibacter tessellarius]|uniref:SAF domain-containing protein n=1 Tax=Clavibacter tessellarius TaxID=31965 RepID=A0A225C735_9MICO|nr:flagella basal body P-ring formation protein FlgA [Clavibacter michiganensis]MBT1635993.1 SAF domain-containing protein [Clavibacter michiganensis]OQJ61590.1 hypothetical protein B5P24_00305 [Clavibacter michiganensis subsp. tessellarius]UKF32709.1 flagella basal body P-ring formation protein FlgA [Clavibacter michiganensis subsp. tessellarius]